MRPIFFLITLVASIQPSFGRTPIEISLGNEEREYPQTSFPVFDQSGEHLISILDRTVRVFATNDGALVREYALPPQKQPSSVEGAFESLYAWDQISLAFGGDRLIVVVGGGTQIFLIDVEELISGANVNPVPIHYQLGEHHPPLHFVCTLGDKNAVFVAGDRTRADRLLLYRLGDNRIDDGSMVDLGSACSRTPSYLSTASIANTETYLAGPSPDGGSLIALRVRPDTKRLTLPSCTAEKIEISWNERAYGALKSVATYRMPTIPVAVSPNLERFMVLKVRMLDERNSQQTVGVSSFDSIQSPFPVRNVLGLRYHAAGRPGLWSGDSTRFFVNDGNQSRRPRPRVISVHDRSGTRISELPLGEGYNGEVMATTNDGRKVVTRMILFQRPRPKERVPNKFTNVKYALWDIR